MEDNSSHSGGYRGECCFTFYEYNSYPQSILFAGCFDNLSLSSIEKVRVQNNNITGVYGNLDITKYLKRISESDVNSLAICIVKLLKFLIIFLNI
ncbi:hypothetical protein OGZ02_00220 [Brachyspira hyodysenteriae]|nr:hypothetical protein [Brachyspira hyodysenteriae]MDA1467297.1 hypothetical protein [Brachyspira hyodysenteriae]